MTEETTGTEQTDAPRPWPGPVESSSAVPDITAGAAVAGVFMSPRETFPKIVEKRWWFALVPIVLGAILSLAGSWIFMNKVDMAQFVRDQIKQSKFSSQMSESQIEEAGDRAAQRPKWVQPVIGVFVIPLMAVILAAIFWLVLLAFGNEITFGRSFQATAWAFLPSLITGVIFLILLFVKDANAIDVQNPIATNLAAILGRDSMPKPLYALLSGLDVFKIWIIALLGIGLGAAGRCRIRTALLSVTVLYAVWIALRMGLAAIF
jgi:hypothetical protein